MRETQAQVQGADPPEGHSRERALWPPAGASSPRLLGVRHLREDLQGATWTSPGGGGGGAGSRERQFIHRSLPSGSHWSGCCCTPLPAEPPGGPVPLEAAGGPLRRVQQDVRLPQPLSSPASYTGPIPGDSRFSGRRNCMRPGRTPGPRAPRFLHTFLSSLSEKSDTTHVHSIGRVY